MKRDMELVRVILLDIEEFDGPNGFMTYDDFYYDGIAETEKQRIRHHLDIMKEAGLIKMGGPDGPTGDVLRSTMGADRAAALGPCRDRAEGCRRVRYGG